MIGIFFNWWYRESFSRFLTYIKTVFAYLVDFFSVMACLNTLFYPWKRDQISYEGLAIKERFEAWMMNLTSRFMGAIVKLFTLATFCVSTIGWSIFSLIMIVFWYIYPVLACALLILSIVNDFK